MAAHALPIAQAASLQYQHHHQHHGEHDEAVATRCLSALRPSWELSMYQKAG
jgi:hypothetical protein